ncbi:MAG: hypothetical protein LAT62_07685 [Natronospirillum sp.]|uniref:hypothetical protein n=1 Tax=Natronospirillum sp. TaxID=2812955 RepID=UPI0025D67C18|nr:hypothetical protein [Natronospirillum sp.]MCH8551801.1 hypothetical protein [Natronospirillum sp.]
MTEKLTTYQVLLHRMVYQKLQWLDYYGEREVPAATEACHTFADLVVQTQADCPDAYLVNLHDACLALCFRSGQSGAFGETLGRLFNNAREIYIAHFYSDPIRVLPSDHPRFDWEKHASPPQNPAAIDVNALTEPLPPPEQVRVRAEPPPRWVMPATLSAVFSLAVVFILIGLAQ